MLGMFFAGIHADSMCLDTLLIKKFDISREICNFRKNIGFGRIMSPFRAAIGLIGTIHSLIESPESNTHYHKSQKDPCLIGSFFFARNVKSDFA